MKDKLYLWAAKVLFVWVTALLTIEMILIIKHLIEFGFN
jgi:hypothetical protein